MSKLTAAGAELALTKKLEEATKEANNATEAL